MPSLVLTVFAQEAKKSGAAAAEPNDKVCHVRPQYCMIGFPGQGPGQCQEGSSDAETWACQTPRSHQAGMRAPPPAPPPTHCFFPVAEVRLQFVVVFLRGGTCLHNSFASIVRGAQDSDSEDSSDAEEVDSKNENKQVVDVTQRNAQRICGLCS